MSGIAGAVAAGSHGDAPLHWLLCDHDRHIILLIRRHMERAGHTVVCTYDGQAAIDQMQKRIENGEKMFDKVVLGLVLPEEGRLRGYQKDSNASANREGLGRA